MENNKKAQEWVDSSVKSSDKFYHSDYPKDRFHCLGFRGSILIASSDANSNLRLQLNMNDPKIFKKIEDFQGVNPFHESTIRFSAFNLSSILSYLGFNRRDNKEFERRYGADECNFNPYFIINGEKKYYQRGYVWNLEQKQALINSIYRGLEIGRCIVHSKGYNLVHEISKKVGFEDFAFRDIVDGKQRILTIISFIKDEFSDEYGNCYSDLSKSAQRAFGNYQGLLYGEMEETSTPEQIADAFLNNAAQGTPISKEHIEYMLKIKETLNK